MEKKMEISQHLSEDGKRLYQNERIARILKILGQKEYVSVKALTEILNYSNATINRDLNVMEKRKLVRRSYGGVELLECSESLGSRYQKMKLSKISLAKKAAEYICDGDTVFIDASTTTEYIGQYLTDKKDITVISNNMALISFLSEYSVKCICLGGEVAEKPYMLCGEDTIKNARGYHADKMFFSTGGICQNGTVSFGGTYGILHQTMMENSDKIFFLADREKIQKQPPGRIKHFDDFDFVIVDFKIDSALKETCPNTVFVEI